MSVDTDDARDGRQSSVRPSRKLARKQEILLWVLLTVGLAIGALFLVREVNKWNPLGGADQWVGVFEVFFAVFGLTYAILIGLFLVESYRRLSELSSIIHSEANALADIHDCLDYFDDNKKNPRMKRIKDRIRSSLHDYVVDILQNDWERMAYPGKEEKAEAIYPPQETRVQVLRKFRDFSSNRWEAFPYKSAALGEFGNTAWNFGKTSLKEYRTRLFTDDGVKHIIGHVKELKPNDDEFSRHALGVIIDRICEITTKRVNRLVLAEQKLKPSLYVLIFIMSVIIFMATLFVPLDASLVWVHEFIVVSTTVALTFLFLLLLDLDHPFIGIFGISEEILTDLKSKLDPGRKIIDRE